MACEIDDLHHRRHLQSDYFAGRALRAAIFAERGAQKAFSVILGAKFVAQERKMVG